MSQTHQQENKKVTKIQVYDNQNDLSLHQSSENCKYIEKNKKKAQITRKLIRVPFENSHISNSQQIDSEIYSEMVSLEQNIVTEHMVCLQSHVSKISEGMFKIRLNSDQIESNYYTFQQYQQTLEQYLQAQKSMIPLGQIDHFISFMEENLNFKRVLEWIYNRVQPQLGDQLILIAHKILLAYLPIKWKLNCIESIILLTQNPFNLQNVYWDSRISLLSMTKLYKYSEGIIEFNAPLFQFHQQFLLTILLVLEQYFHNPGYQKALNQKLIRQKCSVQLSQIEQTNKTKNRLKNSGTN